MEESYSEVILKSLDNLYELACEAAEKRGLYVHDIKLDYKTVRQTIDWNLTQAKYWKESAYNEGWHDAIQAALKESTILHHYGDIFKVVTIGSLIQLYSRKGV